MAFELIPKNNRYSCLSGDAKTTSGILKGSILYETDTSLVYEFNGTAWSLKSNQVKLSESLPTGTNTIGNIGAKWVDTLSAVNSYINVDGMPKVCNQTYLEQIAEGNVTNHEPFLNLGYNLNITTTEEDVWDLGGAYAFPTSELQLEVVSDDNTQDIGTVIKGDATGNTVQADADGTTTTLEDDSVDFTAATAVAVGDCVILDPHGVEPEWGYVTGVAANTLTFANGFSCGGTGASRYYAVVDTSAYTHGQVVNIEYLDSDYVEHREVVVVNGTTPVVTVNTDYFRVNEYTFVGAGSSKVPKGNVRLRLAGGGATYSYITLGYARARSAIYTVAAGKSLFLTTWFAGAANPNDTKVQTVRCTLRSNSHTSSCFTGFLNDGIFNPFDESLVSNNQNVKDYRIPLKFVEKSDIITSAIGFTGFSGPIVSTMRGWLEANS